MDNRHENTDLMSSAIVSTAAGFPISVENDRDDMGLPKSHESIFRALLTAITPRIFRNSSIAEGKSGRTC